MSYADLITKAIESVPEKRLTLSQIYAWMIQNIPYFKDKGESNSSAGWKNSVRHNLSLHRKFVRVQNEGTGKSSWWIVNNEMKSCKSPRRRAASMDNRSYEKKKCPMIAKQNLPERSPTASHTKSDVVSVVPEVQRLDSFATAFSPIDLRSNGKDGALKSVLLSPMGLAAELPLGGDEVMKQPSPLYWNRCHNVNPSYLPPEGLAETVSESLAELYTPDMNSSYEPSFLPDRQLTVLQNISNDKYISDSSYLSFQDLPSPPPYAGHPTTTEDLFPQVNAKDLLQLSTSSNQLDVLSGAQYMTRTGVSMHQGLQGDISPMPKYYPERNEGGLVSEPCGRNSVLRQMLMQAQQQSGILSGYVDQLLESVVKSEPTEIYAFSYRDTNPFPSETMLPAGSVLSTANEGQSSILDYRKSSEYVVIKQETDADILEEDHRNEVWNFSSTSSDADTQRDN